MVCLRPTLVLWVMTEHDLVLCSQHLFPFILGRICSCGCYPKLPRTYLLHTTESYSFIILEAKSLESRCLQGWELSGGQPVPCLCLSFWWLPERLASPGLETHPSKVCLCVCVAFFPMSCVYFLFLPLLSLLFCHLIWGPPKSRMISNQDP